jgi:hypothetical protein
MRTQLRESVPQVDVHAIPLLDASSLPSDDDWALLESIHATTGLGEFEPDADRLGRFNVSTFYDE